MSLQKKLFALTALAVAAVVSTSWAIAVYNSETEQPVYDFTPRGGEYVSKDGLLVLSGNRVVWPRASDYYAGFGCAKCRINFKYTKDHTVMYTRSSGLFALCERCWKGCSKEQRYTYYIALYNSRPESLKDPNAPQGIRNGIFGVHMAYIKNGVTLAEWIEYPFGNSRD